MKRTAAVILIICLLLACTVPADAASLCFIAANDTLLELTAMPYYSGGTTYVPSYVYTYLGIYFNYFPNVSIAMLYSGDKQLYFDLVNGNTYDNNETYYSGSAVSYNGTVYVPMSTVDSYFGFGSSYIVGEGYGDVLRITSSSAVLSDDMFFSAASSLMRSRYNSYYSVPEAPVTTSEPDEELPEDSSAYIAFIGLPSDDLLDALDSLGISAGFFVTAEQVTENDAMLRKIACAGHSLGVYCTDDPSADYEETQQLIFEATLCQTMLVLAPGTEDLPGLAIYTPDISPTGSYTSGILSSIYGRGNGAKILFDLGSSSDSALISVIRTLCQKNYTLLPVREVG